MEHKAAWLGHVIWHGGLAAAVVEGFPEGCHFLVGRPKMRWVDNIQEWSACNITELKMVVLERRVVSKALTVVTVLYNLRRRPRAFAYGG